MGNEAYGLKQVQVRLKLAEAEPLYSTQPINTPDRAAEAMAGLLSQLDREYCCVVNLDGALRPINFNIVSIGGIDSAQIPVQNVFKAAILSNAASVMLLHNHPSGSVSPSREDALVTQKLIEAGKLMDIPVTDHIIIGGGTGERFSFREHHPQLFGAGRTPPAREGSGVLRERPDGGGNGMKEYDITITETLKKTVTVRAGSREETEAAVRAAWENSEYVLGADDFMGVDFGIPDERQLTREKITALLVEPGEYPKTVEMENTLKALQEAVGGRIETALPFPDPICLITNADGKTHGEPLNRQILDGDGDRTDIIAGKFLIVGLGDDNFCSLSRRQLGKFEGMFHQPEAFVRMGKGIMAVPIPDEAVRSRAGAAEKPPAAKTKDSKGHGAL